MVKILTVDDAYFVRIKLRNFLESKGFEVVEAGNGLEAINQLQAEKPDIVFCDITMPEMDGLETLKKLKELNPDVKVVMLTSLGEQTILMEALAAGALNFLVKPFEEDKVLEIINSIIK
ncbi:MAG: response regulator [Candidatus Margulisbacteria bacterium]|nr:response regulator [Candidatus Margulisiibacteriota bacterium]